MLRALPFVAILVLSIFCLVQAITSRDDEIRNLPKIVWVLLILFFPFIGSILWLVAGRPVYAAPSRTAVQFPEYDRPGRNAAPNPDDDAEFLRKVRERAEEQRRKAAEQKAEQERLDAERAEREKQDPEQA